MGIYVKQLPDPHRWQQFFAYLPRTYTVDGKKEVRIFWDNYETRWIGGSEHFPKFELRLSNGQVFTMTQFQSDGL